MDRAESAGTQHGEHAIDDAETSMRRDMLQDDVRMHEVERRRCEAFSTSTIDLQVSSTFSKTASIRSAATSQANWRARRRPRARSSFREASSISSQASFAAMSRGS